MKKSYHYLYISVIGLLSIVAILLFIQIQEINLQLKHTTNQFIEVESYYKLFKFREKAMYMSNGAAVSPKLTLTDENNNYIRFSDLIGDNKDSKKLIIRYSDFACSICLDEELKNIRDFIPKIGIDNILILASSQNIRSLKVRKNDFTADLSIYLIEEKVMLSFKPALNGNIAMLQYLHKHHGEVDLYTSAGSNPYVLIENVKGLTIRFYANDKVKVKNLADVMNSKSKEKLHDDDLVMLWASSDYEREYIEQLGFVEEHRSIPRWIEKTDLFYKVFTNYNYIFVLYSKKVTTHPLLF